MFEFHRVQIKFHHAVRIGRAHDVAEALRIAGRVGRPRLEAVTREELDLRRAESVAVLAEAFWNNRCEPESEAARAQAASYQEWLARVPELAGAGDCPDLGEEGPE